MRKSIAVTETRPVITSVSVILQESHWSKGKSSSCSFLPQSLSTTLHCVSHDQHKSFPHCDPVSVKTPDKVKLLEHVLLGYYHQKIQEDQAIHDLPLLLGLLGVQKHLGSLDHLLHLKDIPDSTKRVSVMLLFVKNNIRIFKYFGVVEFRMVSKM